MKRRWKGSGASRKNGSRTCGLQIDGNASRLQRKLSSCPVKCSSSPLWSGQLRTSDRRASAPMISARSTASLLVRAPAEQSSRCSQCGVPFCQVHCPLGNNIPDWLKLTAEGRMLEAYEVQPPPPTPFPRFAGASAHRTNCARAACVLEQSAHGTITIGAVERYITEHAFDQGWVKPRIPQARCAARSVGIIGAGPAGLAAAEALRASGLRRACLRPVRPRRRAADLRHPQLQAGQGRSSARRKRPAAATRASIST